MIGFLRRYLACRMAAQVFQGKGDEMTGQRIWSVTVFFESYMAEGAEGTREDFGVKDPVPLRDVISGP